MINTTNSHCKFTPSTHTIKGLFRTKKSVLYEFVFRNSNVLNSLIIYSKVKNVKFLTQHEPFP